MSTHVLSRTALRDLDEILQYVVENSGWSRAEALHAEFLRAFEMLASRPGIGHRHEFIADSRPRVWGVHSYLIIYWPKDVPLGIARIVHGARDLTTVDIPSP